MPADPNQQAVTPHASATIPSQQARRIQTHESKMQATICDAQMSLRQARPAVGRLRCQP